MKYDTPKTYAAKHINLNERMKSQSGGAFAAFSSYVIEHNGVVYGCILDSSLNAVHVRAESLEERDKMRGSKYVQSSMRDCFKEVKNDLKNGRIVLFSGTSCQIAGLNSYLNNKYDNLLTIDIICHGVPSPLIWQKYIKWQELRKKSKVLHADFRNKRDFGWRKHIETLYFENKKYTNNNLYSKLFYNHSFLRPSCYKCPYKSIIHPGNITIGDYWGIETIAPDFDDNKGTSIILINDDKGDKWFNNIKTMFILKETIILPSLQVPLHEPFKEPKEREFAWKLVKENKFNKILHKYAHYTYKNRCINIFRIICNNLLMIKNYIRISKNE